MIAKIFRSIFSAVIKHVCLSALATCLFLSISVFANEFELRKIAELTSPKEEHSSWISLQAHPSDAKRYYVANSTGHIFLINDGVFQPNPLLDLKLTLKKKNELILTSIVLHPSFALLEQPGFGRFYTAHVELKNETKRIDRIKAKGVESELKYDAVITEWQLDKTKTKVMPKGHREILRIAIANKDHAINKLAFNPYKKTWDDAYGLLYIALESEPTLKDYPLYSGTLLRINPTKFGLRNFTAPKTNPYIKDAKINKEIYLLGAQNIQNMMWPKSSNDLLLISHIYNQEGLITKAEAGNDWRQHSPNDLLWKSEKNPSIQESLLYYGRSIKNARGKGVFLSLSAQGWQLNSFIINNKKGVLPLPNIEGEIESSLIPQHDHIELFEKNNSEILLFDKSNNVIFELYSTNMDNTPSNLSNDNSISEDSDFNIQLIFIAIFGLFVLILLYKLFYSSIRSEKTYLYKNYVRFEIDHSQQSIALFRRHKEVKDKVIPLNTLISSELYLNEQCINVINDTPSYGFNADIEEDIKTLFKKEKVHKMVNNKVRKIELVLTDNKHHKTVICMYLRKGDQRLTKQPYQESIESSIDWCWYIASLLNKNETPKRVIRVKSENLT